MIVVGKSMYAAGLAWCVHCSKYFGYDKSQSRPRCPEGHRMRLDARAVKGQIRRALLKSADSRPINFGAISA